MRGACLVWVVPTDLIVGKIGGKEGSVAVQDVGKQVSSSGHCRQLGARKAARYAVEPVKQEFHEVSAALQRGGGGGGGGEAVTRCPATYLVVNSANNLPYSAQSLSPEQEVIGIQMAQQLITHGPGRGGGRKGGSRSRDAPTCNL